MSQHDFNIANQGFPATRADLNNALAALASSSSGTSEPSTTYAGQMWNDTTNNLLKFRNDANDAWITFAKLDQATNEWEVRSSVFQAVDSAGIAFKTDEGTTRATLGDDGNWVFTGGATFSGALASSNIPAVGAFSNRNVVINGNFGVNQRAVSGTVVLSAGEYGHDRFKGGASGCTYTFATSQNVTTLTISAGSLVQVVEGVNLQSGTHVLTWTGTSQGKIGAGSYDDTGVTGTATGGADLALEFDVGTLSLIQLEVGDTATPFEHRSYGDELQRCQRYYQVAPQLATILPGRGSSATSITCSLPLATSMRSTPSIPSTLSSVVYSVSNFSSANATISAGSIGDTHFQISFGGFSAAVSDNRTGTVRLIADLPLDAEL